MSVPDLDAIDLQIGRNIRLHRVRAGLSQAKLATHIGMSYQQLQKYERGVNRISASRLQCVANALGTSITAFFPSFGMDAASAELDEGRWAGARTRITDKKLRRLLIELVQHVAGP